MSITTTRPCPYTRPTFFHEVNDVAQTIRYYDPVSGFEAVYDTAAHKLVKAQRQTTPIFIDSALATERKFARLSQPVSVLMSGDLHDTTKAAGSGGGARRSFVSVAFERALLGKQDGRDALHDWAVDQGQRPTAWQPFVFNYDGYFGRLGKWQYDTQDADGWSIFRADHLESATLFGGATLGEDMCLASFCELLKWVNRTFYNPGNKTLQKGWHGSDQKRAMGWMLWFEARAALLGFDTADHGLVDAWLSVRPKDMLRLLVDDLTKRPPVIGSFRPDDRTMVDIGGGEIRGELMFQWAIYFAAIGWIDRSGLMTSKKWKDLAAYSRVLMNEVLWRVMWPDGCSYAFSAHDHFTQDDVDLANQKETDKSHVYSLLERNLGSGFGVIRDNGRTADVELMAAASALLLGPDDQRSIDLLAMLPPPSNMAKYDDLARYADVAWALKEAGNG